MSRVKSIRSPSQCSTIT